jgi:predicted XRE-type DNA-binding protein
VGSSLDDLRDFPKSARRETGFQLDKVQNGEDADDWKPASQGSVPRSSDEEKVIVKTFASVWDAIEDSQSEAASMKARSQLMRVLQKTVRGWNISQKAAADRLGLTQPRLNDLLRGKIDKFSLDALFDLAGRVGLKVSIALRKAA